MERLVKLSLSSMLLISVIFSSCKKDFADLPQPTESTTTDNTGKSTIVVPPKDTTAKPPVVVPPVVTAPSSFGTLNTEENLFDNVWYVFGSLGWNNLTTVTGGAPLTTVAANGETVGKLATKKGKIDISYNGTYTPTMDGKIPVLTSDDDNQGKWLSFKNVPATWYQSANITPINPPYEMWYVMRTMTGQTQEAYFQGGGNCSYVANGGDRLRLINPNYGGLSNSTYLSFYTTHIVRVVVKSQSQAELFIDNVSQGALDLQYPDLNNMAKVMFSVGVITNNADWDFAAEYFKVGNFSSAQINDIYNSLADKWKAGTSPVNQILISDITWTKSGGTITPSATIIPTNVNAADASKWDYQWYWRKNSDNFAVQIPLSNKYQLTTADFPVGYATLAGGFALKCCIRPKDASGKVWRWFDGTFANYN
ncbi:MAG: hypothetical protein V4560_03700 [Bacteroidota bacterium]